jgi:hypothetical protein
MKSLIKLTNLSGGNSDLLNRIMINENEIDEWTMQLINDNDDTKGQYHFFSFLSTGRF